MKEARSWSKPNIARLIGRKQVDASIFKYGTQIPVEFHEDFAQANGSKKLEIGDTEDVILLVNGKRFRATLTNFRYKNSDHGALQLRYEKNKELIELLKKTFRLSYEYFGEKERNSKNGSSLSEKQIEYMDFYQTDTPFVYNVKLLSKSLYSDITFWWVNQGKTYRQEKEGCFLWAPQKNKAGRPVFHHVSLLEAKENDLVFCYSNKELSSIGIVMESAVESPKPSEIEGGYWQKDGYLLKLTYYDFIPSIKKDEIPEMWRKEERGPFNVNGDINQGYFYKVSNNFAKKLFELFTDRFPREVKERMGDYLINEEKGYLKEQKQNTYGFSDKKIVQHIQSYITSKGYLYDKEDVINLYLSLKTKPFVILSGISGTGKTRIARLFAESVGANDDNGQFTLIPIRPDWHDSSDLLGYRDIKGDFKEGPLTKVIKQAVENPDKPYFVLLDEMNLARVEHYFSDILSVMETRDWQDGEIVTTYLFPKESEAEKHDGDDEGWKNLRLPNNLYIIGTVNMDETTHPFSKKVLDRANTIEFNQVDLSNLAFLHKGENVEPIPGDNDHFASKYLKLKDIYEDHKELIERTTKELVKINEILKQMYAHVGYRVRDEICLYLVYNAEGELLDEKRALDYCILQKILPRISGSDSRVVNVLKELYKLFTGIQYQEGRELNEDDLSSADYPHSARKVAEMLRRFKDNGFTSFWIS